MRKMGGIDPGRYRVRHFDTVIYRHMKVDARDCDKRTFCRSRTSATLRLPASAWLKNVCHPG